MKVTTTKKEVEALKKQQAEYKRGYKDGYEAGKAFWKNMTKYGKFAEMTYDVEC